MTLTDNQAKDVLSNPRHKREIQSVKHLESALRVFTEELDQYELQKEHYWHKLQKVIEKRVGSKYSRVCDFFRYPLPIVELTDSILGDFYKVFDGKNKEFNIQGDRDLTRLTDWITNKNLIDWIEEKAKEVFKNKPCSYVVIDSLDGVPVCIMIDQERLIDVKISKETDTVEYIAFTHSVTVDPITNDEVTRVALYDDANYYVFIKDKDGGLTLDETLTTPHDIGYCPATPFIKESNNSKNLFKRRTAFSASVAKLEDWLIFDVFRNYVDHYAPFPVTESIVSKCGNPKCDNGAVKTEETVLEGEEKGKKHYRYTKCPVCDGKGNRSNYVGPGTHIGIKHQTSPNVDDGSGKFRMIFPDVDKLKYTPEKLDDLEVEIRYKTVGVNTMINKEAINEMQAKGSFLSQETVLLRNKTNLDYLYEFIVGTVARLFYNNVSIMVSANFGTEWYLMSEEDLQARFDNAKKIGLPDNEIMSIYRQLVETKYSNNESKRDRELILVDIQDFAFYSLEEMVDLLENNVIDEFELSLKTNFNNFVNRFERENGPVTLFGANLDYDKKITTIKDVFKTYNQEIIDAKTERSGDDTGGDGEEGDDE